MTDPTKREVLTDREMEKAYVSRLGDFLSGLRAVEQAVIAKLLDNNFSPYVSPAEARERERKAWDDAIRYAINTARKWPDAVAVRDCRYPSLTPPKPEGVTLSDGATWAFRRFDIPSGWARRKDGGIKTLGDADWVIHYQMTGCRTPEDFEAVARYLRELEGK